MLFIERHCKSFISVVAATTPPQDFIVCSFCFYNELFDASLSYYYLFLLLFFSLKPNNMVMLDAN